MTLPGLANAHSHAFHRVLRGRTQRGAGSFWSWREQMYEVAAGLDPDGYRDLARAVFAEMVLAGITTVAEFHYVHHDPAGRTYADPNAMGHALAEAAVDAGLRLTLLDTCYLQAGPDRPPAGPQVRFADADADAWAVRVDGFGAVSAGVRLGAAIHSVRAVDPAAMATVAAWADAAGAPLHAHVSEQPAENEACLAAHGCTPTALLAAHGALGPRFTAVHLTHSTEADLTALGAAGSTACLCPTTERDLADGVAPASRLRDAGVGLALGSDSHAVIDLFEEARAVELDERLVRGGRGHLEAPVLLTAATAGGHRAAGWPGAGVLAVGRPADLVTVSLTSVRTAGTRPVDALDGVVFAATAADVTHVVVGGAVVVRDGHHVRLDVAAELARTVGRW